MADQFDKASDLEAFALLDALNTQQRNAARAPKLQPVGHCLNPACEEPFTDPARLFCNPRCGTAHAFYSRK